MWFDNPLMYVDADAIEPLVNDYYKTIFKCVRIFSDMPKVQTVAITIRVCVLFSIKNFFLLRSMPCIYAKSADMA